MIAVLFNGRSSSPLGFLFQTLLTDFGTNEFPSSVPFASLASSFIRATAALILCLATSISTKVIEALRKADGNTRLKLCERFTYGDESIRLIFELLASA